MTTRPPDEAPLTGAQDDGDAPWVSVRPDSRTVKSPLIAAAPLIAIGALRMGLMMDRGRGTSEGSGTTGFVVGLLAVAFPLVLVGVLTALRWANAGILLEDGVLTVRDRWNRKVLHAPVSELTGVHTLRAPVDGPHGGRVVLTSRTRRPVLVDPRQWNPEALARLWRELALPAEDHGFVTWPVLRQRFPGIRPPWRHVHVVQFGLLAAVVTIGYIALVVNLPFFL
ncbi:hypothetical protein [Streptomyces anandii]|uniref:hypothetical protein n=1 Tax=Streptomyces anandii TaxID=285454 RepID=UPI001679976D|nr:hypothetical protein [Streptomyces anandii]GGX96985.1 hypothetical protein GCM10010510_48080 [Streptomyces anandii JCM 4720]